LQELRQQALARLGMGTAQLDRLLLDAEPRLGEAARLLGVDLPPGTSHDELLARAMLHIAALSADTAAELSVGRRRTAELADENQRLSSQTRTDPLTGLANRRTFDDFLHRQLVTPATARRGEVLGLLVIDLDRFKDVNDTYGHTVGDQVLRAIATLLARVTRRDDLAARFGGEEFVVVLPHTGPAGVARAADRLRQAIAGLDISTRSGTLRVTASIGGACATHGSGPEAALALIDRADVKLYEAKRSGRNACHIDPTT
jgi:two-component system, cell cycle response regulator